MAACQSDHNEMKNVKTYLVTKNKVKTTSTYQEFNKLLFNHVKFLLVHNKFLELLHLENNHVTGKSI